MQLALQITKPPIASSGPNAIKIFGESGGTIGRVKSNDWVLHDDERFISGRHAIIRFMNGAFWLEDVSTNGTFVNDATETVGSSNEPVVLKSGDRIIIGDYEIYVSVVEDQGAGAPEPEPPAFGPDSVLTSPTGTPTQPPAPPSAPAYGAGSSAIGPLDPLDLLDEAPRAPSPPPPPSFPDHSPSTSDYFRPPTIPGADTTGPSAIGDDFLDDITGFSPASPPPAAPRPPAMPPQPSYAPPAPQAPSPMPPPSFSGSGNQYFDQVMPIIVQGMMDVLKSRADIKSQFRLALTTIKPVENNPLKFSPNVQDAMGHLFGGGQAGFLGPVEAFEEGFNDIKAHQLAMIAGMRAAFEHMLHQFSPEVLEEHFEGGAKRSKLMGIANKVRYWDLYRDMFDRITRDSDDNFRRLFGEEFASAYEEQMQKIAHRF